MYEFMGRKMDFSQKTTNATKNLMFECDHHSLSPSLVTGILRNKKGALTCTQCPIEPVPQRRLVPITSG
jgi:hypothetical protein